MLGQRGRTGERTVQKRKRNEAICRQGGKAVGS